MCAIIAEALSQLPAGYPQFPDHGTYCTVVADKASFNCNLQIAQTGDILDNESIKNLMLAWINDFFHAFYGVSHV
jgi:hypothetical protein